MWNNVDKAWYLQHGETSSSETGPVGDNGGLTGGKFTYIIYTHHDPCCVDLKRSLNK